MPKKNHKSGQRRKAMSILKQVAFNIKRVRKQAGLTQEYLQEKSGIAIARCETGRYDMTLTTIAILSSCLNIAPYELLK